MKLCTVAGYPLYPFREGHNPYIAKREYTDEQKEAIKARLSGSRQSAAREKSEN